MLDMNSMIERFTRIARLDNTVWSEIQHDEDATSEALVLVLLAALLSALGAGIGGRGFFGPFLLRLTAIPLLNWLFLSFATAFVGTRFFEGRAGFWEMARVLGYATAPLALGVLGIVPCMGWRLVPLIGWAVSIVVGFLATREVLDLPTDRAIITFAIPWLIIILVYWIVL